jgi:hypothetical protein
MQKSSLIDFCRIFKNKKQKSADCAAKDFQKRSSTKR